ncbi:MAG TPA: FUN14 domain-containing protein [Planctomycetota bacterium]|nr:FUN14 domain-containing protein [Planctomycetota bacterium]
MKRDEDSSRSPRPEKGSTGRRRLPRWKKGLLVAAAVLFVLGCGLQVYARFRGPEDAHGRRSVANRGEASRLHGGEAGKESPFSRSLVGETETPRPGADKWENAGGAAAEDWSPALMKGGLGFFVGFCVGYAVRTFLKVSAFILGVIFLGVLALAYFQVIPPIDWTSIEGHFQRIVAGIREQASGFQAFLAGNLPSATLATAGLFTGFKKN